MILFSHFIDKTAEAFSSQVAFLTQVERLREASEAEGSAQRVACGG